jgi:hypothetical protein
MKKILSCLMLLLLVVTFGCSNAPSTPQEQLTEISKMLSKGYEMTDNQRQAIDDQVVRANELLASGNTEEASKILTTALVDLELIAETDRFNKSE